MVFELLGETLLGLIRRYEHGGIPLPLVKQIAKQVLLALDYMHGSCEIIHTDIKLENILICIEDVENVVRSELRNTPTDVPKHSPLSQRNSIIGSQPLSCSPSVSASSSPSHLDRWGFGMSQTRTEGASSDVNAPTIGSSSTDPDQEHQLVQDLLRRSTNDPGCSAAPTNTRNDTNLSPIHPAHVPSENTTPTSQPHPQDYFHTVSSHSPSRTPPPPGNPLDTSFHSPPPEQPSTQTPMTSPDSPIYDLDFLPSYDETLPTGSSQITVKIADFGNACWTTKHFTDDIQTRQYRSPEVILGKTWDSSADLWSAACLFFELVTGDYLFEPVAGRTFRKDDDHLAQILELLGPMNQDYALSGAWSTEYFNSEGQLRYISHLKPWALEMVLLDKYGLDPILGTELVSFLLPMLRYDRHERCTARDALVHPWLQGVLVEGKNDTQGRLERWDRTDSVRLSVSGSKRESAAVLTDALKPADYVSPRASQPVVTPLLPCSSSTKGKIGC